MFDSFADEILETAKKYRQENLCKFSKLNVADYELITKFFHVKNDLQALRKFYLEAKLQ